MKKQKDKPKNGNPPNGLKATTNGRKINNAKTSFYSPNRMGTP